MGTGTGEKTVNPFRTGKTFLSFLLIFSRSLCGITGKYLYFTLLQKRFSPFIASRPFMEKKQPTGHSVEETNKRTLDTIKISKKEGNSDNNGPEHYPCPVKILIIINILNILPVIQCSCRLQGR
jgi:hypothetical protein